MTVKPLSHDDIVRCLRQLEGWKQEGNHIIKHYTFPNFSKAMAFMVEAAVIIEKYNHHPEWYNVYNKLEIKLTTHDSRGITHKDIDLAKALDAIYTSS